MLLLACEKSDEIRKEKTAVKKETAAVKQKGPVLKLRYDFNKGDRFSYKLQTNTNNVEEISADTTLKNDITQKATYIMDFRVKNITNDYSAEMEVKISSIKAETIFNGESIKYDSKFLYSTRERIQFVVYEAVKQVPVQIIVNPIGQVIKVEKTEKIMRNILDIQKIPDTLSQKTKDEMLFTISNGTLMPLTQQIFKVLSADEVGIDSVWQLKFNTPMAVFNIENTAVFKITDLKFEQDTIAEISSNLFINVKGNNVVNEKGVTYTFSQPLVNAEGKVRYNNSRGLVEFSESVTKIEMTMYMQGVDNENNQITSTKKDFSTNKNIVELL
jgi:hypothetical protein